MPKHRGLSRLERLRTSLLNHWSSSSLPRHLGGWTVGCITLLALSASVMSASPRGETPAVLGLPGVQVNRTFIFPPANTVEVQAAALPDFKQMAAARKKMEEDSVEPGSDEQVAASKAFARTLVADPVQYTCLVELWRRESNWRVNALNADSGAYGIPQALPANKMASAGKDWRTNPRTQITWGVRYIDRRYGTPCEALAYARMNGWY